MPMKSEAQRRMMQAAAHNPKFAKQAGVSQKVAKEFVSHDTGGKLPKRAPSGKGRKKGS